MIGVGAITLANALAPITTLLSIENNLTMLVDTTLPYTYLPLYVCQQLEQAFGLQWDAAHQTYLISNTTHQQLLKAAPSITFTLSTSLPAPAALNITIPYAAFDLTATYPIFPNGTNYFPLRRANDSTQFILGRAFMQEAYLFVDYETSQFTISPAAYPASGTQDLVTVDHSANGTSGSGSMSGDGSGLSVGAIAGVAIGSSVATVLLCTLAWFCWRVQYPRRKNRRRRKRDDVWRAPVSQGPSANSSGSSGPEKSILTSTASSSYVPPSAFRAYRSDQSRSRALSDYQRQSQSTQFSSSHHSPMSSIGKLKSSWRSPGHSRKSSSGNNNNNNYSNFKDVRNVRISHPTAPMRNGKAMPDVEDPWQTSVLDMPQPLTAPKKATAPPPVAAAPDTMGHVRMFSILDDDEIMPNNNNNEKPSARAPRPGLPKLNTMQETNHAPKEWETPKEWESLDVGWSPSPISPPERSLSHHHTTTSSSRPSYYYSSSHQSRQNSFTTTTTNNNINTIIVDSEPSSSNNNNNNNSNSKHASKPSVSSEASRTRQKHIWDMQQQQQQSPSTTPSNRSRSHSRAASPSRQQQQHRSKTSFSSMGGGVGAHATIPEIPPTGVNGGGGGGEASSEEPFGMPPTPTPTVSPGPESAARRRKHIWELQSPGGGSASGSRGGSRKHSRSGTRELSFPTATTGTGGTGREVGGGGGVGGDSLQADAGADGLDLTPMPMPGTAI